jgi:hypothetical protein
MAYLACRSAPSGRVTHRTVSVGVVQSIGFRDPLRNGEVPQKQSGQTSSSRLIGEVVRLEDWEAN